ncbi:hypothetical protein HY489_04885 [Candidatus Woesearchaeota archaeon]|nr:hypothetical protein [Candidatus Woesearchaeota archaeon]
MITLAEVGESFERINGFFRSRQINAVRSEIMTLHERLQDELKSAHTDLDQLLLELRSNLKTYLDETDLATSEAGELFAAEIVKKFIDDIKLSEIKRLINLAERLERLQWA